MIAREEGRRSDNSTHRDIQKTPLTNPEIHRFLFESTSRTSTYYHNDVHHKRRYDLDSLEKKRRKREKKKNKLTMTNDSGRL